MNKTSHLSPVVDTTNGVIRMTRHQPPSHFIWKIESYSKLLLSKWEKIESGYFEVDDRKWKLTFYPNGDNKGKGSYISLYLSVLDTEEEELSLSWDLSIKFQFFVFDQIHNKYLVIQDVKDACPYQYQMKSEWGITQLLSLGDFKDPVNGFLLNDCCIFGVDVFVTKACTRRENFSVVQPISSANSYTFKIGNFSTIDKEYVESEVFTIHGKKWKIWLYPKGNKREGKKVSLYLHLAENFNNKVYATYKLRMIDQVHNNHLEMINATSCFGGSQLCCTWGYKEFVDMSDVNNKSKGYLVKDTMMVQVEILYVSVVKNFS